MLEVNKQILEPIVGMQKNEHEKSKLLTYNLVGLTDEMNKLIQMNSVC